MSRFPLKDQVIWVTGASYGIGRAVAREFLMRGCRVAVSARSEELLAELADEFGRTQVHLAPLDVTDREANLEAVRSIRKRFGGLDIAFLNAGTCEYVDLNEFNSEIFARQMEINFMGLIYGIEAALPYLKRSGRGRIVGMSSAAAIRGLPRAAAYGATKAAIAYALESLRIDLADKGVEVTTVYPGFVKTPLTDKNTFAMPMLMNAEKAARIIVDGIERGKQEIRFPKRLTLGLQLSHFIPTGIYTQLCRRLLAGK